MFAWANPARFSVPPGAWEATIATSGWVNAWAIAWIARGRKNRRYSTGKRPVVDPESDAAADFMGSP